MRFQVVQDNLGKLFLIDTQSRKRYPITGTGQLNAAVKLYGPVQTKAAGGGPILLTGWTQGPAVVDLFGGAGGIEKVVAGTAASPLDGKFFADGKWGSAPRANKPDGPAPAPVTAPAPVVAPRDFRREAKLLFPWLPDALLDVYAEEWQRTGDPGLALARMRQAPAYKQHFPGNVGADGRMQMSEQEYMEYREQATHIMRQAGLPAGFYDEPADFGKLIGGQVSLEELGARVQRGYVAAMNAPAETRDQLQRLYGIGPGALAAFFLDPKRGLETIQKQWASSQIAGAADRTGFGAIGKGQAERLFGLGVDEQQAQQGFNQLASAAELMHRLPGELGTNISKGEQMAATFEGDAAAQDKIRRSGERRVAAFQDGGGAAVGQAGVIGLGGR